MGVLDRPVFTVTTLDSTGTVGEFTSITIGTDGFAIVSYFDSTNGDLKVAHCSNVACTATTNITTLDSGGALGGNVGSYTSIAIGADSLAIISYSDGTNGDLKVAHCSNVTCTSATITTLDSDGSVGIHTSITIGADGLAIISYYDTTNGDLKVAHCSNVTCTAATTTTVDSTDDVGSWTSITIGADGLAIISYFDATNIDLKVAHCSNLACTAATITAVDDSGTAGGYSSIIIGGDGLAIISYFDDVLGLDINRDLKVAHCSNVTCTAATITTLDSTDNVGYYTSITIGADGLAIISYFDDKGNFDLKVAHCSNVTCTAATT
ncbi:MAG: hypothetical protein HYX95_00335, partial [Chloroflexi bacterium]|nr:hypothetical protein [Chloroflexota bacterium]